MGRWPQVPTRSLQICFRSSLEHEQELWLPYTPQIVLQRTRHHSYDYFAYGSFCPLCQQTQKRSPGGRHTFLCCELLRAMEYRRFLEPQVVSRQQKASQTLSSRRPWANGFCWHLKKACTCSIFHEKACTYSIFHESLELGMQPYEERPPT